ncbi:MAG: hypothetical protein KC708_21750 [Anaerolineae bacterium]|nr:hypothetical protein [Anaerolineae bacterium]
MQSTVPKGWIRWMNIVCGLFILYGLALVLLPSQVQDVQGAIYYNWPLGEDAYSQLTSIEYNYHIFLYGVIGGVLIGWSVLIIAVVNGPLQNGYRWAWQALVISLVAWFVTDTLISLATGMTINGLFNLVSTAAFAIPLFVLRPYMASRQETSL